MPRTARATVNTSRGRPSSSSVQDVSSDAVGMSTSSSSGVVQGHRNVVPDDDEMDEEEEDGELGNIPGRADDVQRVLADFEKDAQILTKEVADPSLRNMVNEWAPLAGTLQSAMTALRNVAEKKAETLNISEVGEEDATLKRMDETCRRMIDLQQSVETHRAVLGELRESIANGTEIVDAAQHYAEKIENDTTAYRSKTKRAKYGSNKSYEKYKTQVWNAMHIDSVMPPLSELIPAESGDEEDDGDEVAVMGGSLQEYKCPITLQIMQDPVRSDVCNHAFERAAIYAMLGSATKPCPAQCRSRIKKSNLIEDPELRRACKAYERRLERHRDRIRTQVSATMLD